MEHFVVYSHGFGVDRTDRGLMADIAASMPESKHILFDYNHVDQANNILTVNPLDEQARRLRERLDALDDGTEKVVDIVAHSQGCIVAALAQPRIVSRVMCLTPPSSLSVERMVAIFGARPGSHIDLAGESSVPRRDGTTTIIPKQYWQGLSLDVPRLYASLCDAVEKITFYTANRDEVLGVTHFEHLDPRIEWLG